VSVVKVEVPQEESLVHEGTDVISELLGINVEIGVFPESG
jgi:hypothetical protein